MTRTGTLQLAQINAQQLWSHPSWDLVLVFVLFVAALLYAILAGRKKIFSTIIYTYMTIAIFSALPLDEIASTVSAANPFFAKAGLFLVMLTLFSLLLSHGKHKGIARVGTWWQVFLLSFLQVGLLIHIILGFLPSDKTKLLSPLTKYLFANPSLHVWWLLLPVATLMFIRRINVREEW